MSLLRPFVVVAALSCSCHVGSAVGVSTNDDTRQIDDIRERKRSRGRQHQIHGAAFDSEHAKHRRAGHQEEFAGVRSGRRHHSNGRIYEEPQVLRSSSPVRRHRGVQFGDESDDGWVGSEGDRATADHIRRRAAVGRSNIRRHGGLSRSRPHLEESEPESNLGKNYGSKEDYDSENFRGGRSGAAAAGPRVTSRARAGSYEVLSSGDIVGESRSPKGSPLTQQDEYNFPDGEEARRAEWIDLPSGERRVVHRDVDNVAGNPDGNGLQYNYASEKDYQSQDGNAWVEDFPVYERGTEWRDKHGNKIHGVEVQPEDVELSSLGALEDDSQYPRATRNFDDRDFEEGRFVDPDGASPEYYVDTPDEWEMRNDGSTERTSPEEVLDPSERRSGYLTEGALFLRGGDRDRKRPEDLAPRDVTSDVLIPSQDDNMPLRGEALLAREASGSTSGTRQAAVDGKRGLVDYGSSGTDAGGGTPVALIEQGEPRGPGSDPRGFSTYVEWPDDDPRPTTQYLALADDKKDDSIEMKMLMDKIKDEPEPLGTKVDPDSVVLPPASESGGEASSVRNAASLSGDVQKKTVTAVAGTDSSQPSSNAQTELAKAADGTSASSATTAGGMVGSSGSVPIPPIDYSKMSSAGEAQEAEERAKEAARGIEPTIDPVTGPIPQLKEAGDITTTDGKVVHMSGAGLFDTLHGRGDAATRGGASVQDAATKLAMEAGADMDEYYAARQQELANAAASTVQTTDVGTSPNDAAIAQTVASSSAAIPGSGLTSVSSSGSSPNANLPQISVTETTSAANHSSSASASSSTSEANDSQAPTGAVLRVEEQPPTQTPTAAGPGASSLLQNRVDYGPEEGKSGLSSSAAKLRTNIAAILQDGAGDSEAKQALEAKTVGASGAAHDFDPVSKNVPHGGTVADKAKPAGNPKEALSASTVRKTDVSVFLPADTTLTSMDSNCVKVFSGILFLFLPHEKMLTSRFT